MSMTERITKTLDARRVTSLSKRFLGRAQRRSAEWGTPCDLTTDYIERLFYRQEGRCKVSGRNSLSTGSMGRIRSPGRPASIASVRHGVMSAATSDW
jgi:hypothetical protein